MNPKNENLEQKVGQYQLVHLHEVQDHDDLETVVEKILRFLLESPSHPGPPSLQSSTVQS